MGLGLQTPILPALSPGARGEGHLPSSTLGVRVPVLSPVLSGRVPAVPICDTEQKQSQTRMGPRGAGHLDAICRVFPKSHSMLSPHTDIQPPEVSASPAACVIGILGAVPGIPGHFVPSAQGW